MADIDLEQTAGGPDEAGKADTAGTEAAGAGAEEGKAAGGEGGTQEVGAVSQGKETILGESATEAEEYDFKSLVPQGMEYNEEQAAAFGEIARGMNLTKEQASQLGAYGMKYAQEVVKAYEDNRQREIEGWAAETKKTLGIDYDSTIAKAGAGIEALEKVIPNIRAAMNYTGAGNRIEFVQMLAFVGDLTKEDNFRGFGANSGAVKSNIYGKTNFGLY